MNLRTNAGSESIDWPFITLEDVATITGNITDIANASDGSGRLFIAEQKGHIFIVRNGIVLPGSFIDISGQVKTSSELGLVGIAFAPDFKTSGEFYLDYNRKEDGATVISRFKTSSNPNSADSASEVKLLISSPNSLALHTAGQIAFGPDGYLYIATGDATQNGSAQNPGSLLGKMLRIDVSGSASTYKVPTSNPFVGNSLFNPEIWALGLRNPWRFSFDALTGDMYIGDVGADHVEEIDFQPHDSMGGENYGWPWYEGSSILSTPGTNDTTFPVAEYTHAGFGPRDALAVIGGRVSRESETNRLFGIYLYADYGTGRIFGLKKQGTHWVTAQLTRPFIPCSTFGQDEQGRMYLATQRPSKVFRLKDSPKCFTPSFSPGGGRYTKEVEVTVNCLTPGATIHYRRTSGIPDISDPAIAPGGKLLLSTAGSLSARAFRDDLEPSDANSEPYNLSVAVQFTPSQGPVTNSTPLLMKASTSGAVIHYTRDGSEPDTNSPAYNGPITLLPNETIRAMGSKAGWLEGVVTSSFYGLLLPIPVTIRTWAGTEETGYSDTNAASATFNAPQGICVDGVGNIYVADTGNKRIRKLALDGNVTTFGGDGFFQPVGICVNKAGELFVADRITYTISKILPDGSTSLYAGMPDKEIFRDGPKDQAGFLNPDHLEMDDAGNLYIGDWGRVRRISADGVVTTVAGNGNNDGPLGWSGEIGIGLTSQGQIVAAVGGTEIYLLTPEGQQSTLAGTVEGHADGSRENGRVTTVYDLLRARDAAGDKQGNVYLTDKSWVRKIEPDGTLRTLVPSDANVQQGLVPPFGFAAGIALGKSGEIYVADTDRNAIYRLDFDSDQDGIPDTEEGGTSAFVPGADDRLRDNDGDGMSNSSEYIAGTNPDDATSNFRLSLQHDPDGARILAWKSATERKYKLQQSNDLTDWTEATLWLGGNGETMTLGLSKAGFFRVVASLR